MKGMVWRRSGELGKAFSSTFAILSQVPAVRDRTVECIHTTNFVEPSEKTLC